MSSSSLSAQKMKPLVIVGPSGVGKGTLIEKLNKNHPSKFGFSVSHTTRAPRPGEENGVHYHFVEKSLMEREIADGKFLEHANVHLNIYGTSFKAVEDVASKGVCCILDIDIQGAEIVKSSGKLECAYVFIQPPSIEELEKRLRGRGTETEEAIAKRMENATKEIERGEALGAAFFDAIIVNDDIDKAYEKLRDVIGSSIFGVASF
jgi:guanylate kinase